MTQPLLFPLQADTSLTCAFGGVWADHFSPIGCPLCEAEVERGCAAFDAAVARGEYDEFGYTPAERRAQATRQAAA